MGDSWPGSWLRVLGGPQNMRDVVHQEDVHTLGFLGPQAEETNAYSMTPELHSFLPLLAPSHGPRLQETWADWLWGLACPGVSGQQLA